MFSILQVGLSEAKKKFLEKCKLSKYYDMLICRQRQ